MNFAFWFTEPSSNGGRFHADKMLAILPEGRKPEMQGIPAIGPAFGLLALWIDKQHRMDAKLSGCTVVHASTVIITC
jgi:flagellar biosynthesis protein FlhA